MIKKWFCVGLTALCMVSINASANEIDGYKLGDVDLDGTINANDAALTMQYVLNNTSVNLSDLQIALAKVTGNIEITANDASSIFQKTLNASYKFPAEEESTETTTESSTEVITEEETESTTVDIKDVERFEKIDTLIGQMLSSNPPDAPTWNTEKVGYANWNYINGCMLKGFKDLYDITGDTKYMDFNDTFMNYYVAQQGNIPLYKLGDYNLDNINSGKVLFSLYEYTGKEKYRKAIDTLYSQISNQPRTSSGNFWHKQVYPNQVWLDGLYMAQPFYLEYESTYNNNINTEDIFNQFNNVYNIMKDDATGLYYHGYDDAKSQSWADTTTGLSQSFWLRAMAWYAMAQVDTIELMPEDSAENVARKGIMIEQFAEYMQAVRNYQDSDTGMWYQVVDKGSSAGNYLETSGSAGMAYSMMKGSRLGYLDSSFYDSGKKAFNGICDNKLYTESNGVVLSDICIVSGLGGISKSAPSHPQRDGSYEYYIAEKIGTNDAKGIAPLLYAYCEVMRNGVQ